jgi:hypothetical protein
MINEAADIDFHKYDYGENNVINGQKYNRNSGKYGILYIDN